MYILISRVDDCYCHLMTWDPDDQVEVDWWLTKSFFFLLLLEVCVGEVGRWAEHACNIRLIMFFMPVLERLKLSIKYGLSEIYIQVFLFWFF